MHLSRAQFPCRAAESEARRGHGTLRSGFSGRHQPPPYCLDTHVREAALSGVGVQTSGGDFTVRQQCLCPGLHLTERSEEGAAGDGPICQHSTSCLSSGRLCTQAPNFQPERDALRSRQSWLPLPVTLIARPITALQHASQFS